MTIRVGINGMGRIGRMITRAIIENQYESIKIQHINNRTDPETCSKLLKYDSVHGKFNACLLYTSPSPRDPHLSRMPSSA